MFVILTNVQRGEAVPLQQYIDNRNRCLRIGLRSMTFAVGWYNVGSEEKLSWRAVGEVFYTADVQPGLYDFAQLKAILEGTPETPHFTLVVNKVNGLITVADGREVLLSDGLLSLLCLDDGIGGTWLDAGAYDGDHPVNFVTRKLLEEIDTKGNIVDGRPSRLLTNLGIGCHVFGDIRTVRIEHPEYKRLQNGTLGELKML